jgi:hypothetical protein
VPKRTRLELLLDEQIRDKYRPDPEHYPTVRVQLPEPKVEYLFHPTRKWKFDFAWPQAVRPLQASHIFGMVAVEVEGGSWVGGRHVRPAEFEKDCEKYAEALIMGWRVLRVTGHMVEDGRAIEYLRRIFR